MKIAVFEPYIEGIGGAQKVILKYSDYLQSKGNHIEIFTQRYDPKTAYPGFNKLKINIIKPTSKNFSPFAFFKKFNGFDIFILNDFPSNFVALRNKPTIWICYSPKRYFYDLKKYYFKIAPFKEKILLWLKNLLFKRIDLFSSKKISLILPISETVQERVKKYYGRMDTEIFYCGIDFKNYKSGKYGDYVLCVSRFVKPKRVDVIVKSMGFVKNKKIELYVVGDGPEKENIKNLCGQQNNVKFIGKVSEKRLKELYSNCLAVVYCPINEDGPLVPLEAAASEKTIIGAKEGGLKEQVINQKTGFLLDKITPKKIAEKIDYFAFNKKIAEKMGIESKKYAKKYDWKNSLPDLDKVIEELHGRSK